MKKSAANNLITKRNKLPDHRAEANELDNNIAKILAKEERNKTYLFKQFCDKSGATDVTAMWKLKKTWTKKAHALPVAKLSHGGHLVTAHGELKRLLLK